MYIFRGDYRSGKRLNMRRLVPYIASNYRKNQIWMRRTKPAKRTYHVCLAIDDSGSMKENLMTEIACQTICLLEKAFKHLEIGQISICKFGQEVDMLVEDTTQVDIDQVGPKVLESLQFSQTKTDLENLLVQLRHFFGQTITDGTCTHQLMIIIGDGRGTMVQGPQKIKRQVQSMIDEGVTVLYLVVDNPRSSVFTMQVVQKTPEGKIQLKDYMSLFPFPFYTVVQSAAVIPAAVSEALKQWFDALLL